MSRWPSESTAHDLTKRVVVIVALSTLALAVAGCGGVLHPDLGFQHSDPFHFRSPPCLPAPPPEDTTPDDAVVIRYLGAGGLFIGWRGEGLLTGPFFSNPRLPRVAFGRIRSKPQAIRQGLDDLPLDRVGAILVGHSHYDHLADLPDIAHHFTPRARLWVNRSGADALIPYLDLAERIRVLEGHERRWTQLSDADGRPMPFRVWPLRSDHAPHAGRLRLWDNETKANRRPFSRRRYPALQSGQPYAFIIDLLEPADPGAQGERPEYRVRFRLYYQDAASVEPHGFPPDPAPGDPPYDLAVLCAASSHLVAPAPAGLLQRTAPSHVLVTHYENFFAAWERRRGFVPLLTNRRMARFLRRIEAALPAHPNGPPGPRGPVCGPSNRSWTIPLVEEWLTFHPSISREAN